MQEKPIKCTSKWLGHPNMLKVFIPWAPFGTLILLNCLASARDIPHICMEDVTLNADLCSLLWFQPFPAYSNGQSNMPGCATFSTAFKRKCYAEPGTTRWSSLMAINYASAAELVAMHTAIHWLAHICEMIKKDGRLGLSMKPVLSGAGLTDTSRATMKYVSA